MGAANTTYPLSKLENLGYRLFAMNRIVKEQALRATMRSVQQSLRQLLDAWH